MLGNYQESSPIDVQLLKVCFHPFEQVGLGSMNWPIMLPTNCLKLMHVPLMKRITLQSLQNGSINIAPELHGVHPLSDTPLRRGKGMGRGTSRVH